MGRFTWLVLVVAACGGSSSTPTRQPVLTNATNGASPEQARNEVVKEALMALASGDVDRLMSLADPKGIYEYAFSCKDSYDDELGNDSKELAEGMRKDFTKAIAGTKGARVEVVSIRNEMRNWDGRRARERNATFIAKGGAISQACTAKADLLFHEVEVRVRISKGSDSKEVRSKFELLHARGRWYVTKVPKDLSAGDASGAIAKMEEFSNKMCACKDKNCADAVNEEMTKWGTEMARSASYDYDERPDPDMARRSADIMTRYTECMTKLMMAGAPP